MTVTKQKTSFTVFGDNDTVLAQLTIWNTREAELEYVKINGGDVTRVHIPDIIEKLINGCI